MTGDDYPSRTWPDGRRTGMAFSFTEALREATDPEHPLEGDVTVTIRRENTGTDFEAYPWEVKPEDWAAA